MTGCNSRPHCITVALESSKRPTNVADTTDRSFAPCRALLGTMSLAALLAEERRFTADVSLLEGLLCGFGGFARETAFGVGWLTRGARLRNLPLALEGPLLMALVPIGMTRGVQRMLLLVAVGLLSLTRSTVEASRGLLRCHGSAVLCR